MPRPTPAAIANHAATIVLIGLAVAAVALVARIGPLGLVLLGFATLFVCSQFSLDDTTPTWGRKVFQARMTPPRSPEGRAAEAAERQATLAPLRFYQACGALLVAVGVAVMAWQASR